MTIVEDVISALASIADWTPPMCNGCNTTLCAHVVDDESSQAHVIARRTLAYITELIQEAKDEDYEPDDSADGNPPRRTEHVRLKLTVEEVRQKYLAMAPIEVIEEEARKEYDATMAEHKKYNDEVKASRADRKRGRPRSLKRLDRRIARLHKIGHRQCASHRLLTDIDRHTYQWFVKAQELGTPISGADIQKVALERAQELGIQSAASLGWLKAFKQRFGISQSQLNQTASSES